eukprot:1557390-Lingulodinium_polyedra.AAC.1
MASFAFQAAVGRLPAEIRSFVAASSATPLFPLAGPVAGMRTPRIVPAEAVGLCSHTSQSSARRRRSRSRVARSGRSASVA